MQKQLYPVDQVEHSLEQHLSRHSTRSQVIYSAILLALLAGVALLPIVRVGVSVQSSGIIRPVTEKHELKARTSGFADRVEVRQGARVEKGQILYHLRAAPLEERISLLTSQLAQQQDFIHDLELLTGSRTPQSLALGAFRTPKYRQEYVQLTNELAERKIQEEKALRELDRTRSLTERNLAPLTQLDDHEFRLQQIRSERALLVERYQSGWQSALTSARMDLEELRTQEGQMEEERSLYTVRSPVTGSVEQVASISPGSYVQAGEQLAVVSPDSGMVAEIYVSPRDVGLLRVGMPARILVDAFNYNDWGFASGRIDEISSDFMLVNQQPVFRARVLLDDTHLQLRNGFRGELRKGMTLRARFIVAERTLLQLLRDDINDWLNPVVATR